METKLLDYKGKRSFQSKEYIKNWKDKKKRRKNQPQRNDLLRRDDPYTCQIWAQTCWKVYGWTEGLL